MAPEQLAGDPTADHRIDLYAVGLLAYELLSGESPFAGPSPRETMAAQLTRDPKPLHEVNPSVSSGLSSLIMRLLAKDPDKRPASADIVLEELDSMTLASGPSTPVSGGIMAAPTRSLTRVFAVIGLVAVVLVTVVMLTGDSRAQRRAQNRARTDSVRHVSDSLVKLAQAAPVVVAPPALSHQDSLAIAEKVNKAMRASRTRDSVARARLQDSIQRAEEKKARDSLFRAYGARSTSTSKRRIVVVEPRPSTRWPELEQIGRAVADSLRAMLSKRAYIVVNPDSVRALRLQFTTAEELSKALSSDLLVSIRIEERTPRRGTTGPDSVMLRITAYDQTARSQYRQRTLPAGTLWSVHEEILAPLEALLLQTVGALEEMSRAPRKAPGDPEPAILPGFPGAQVFIRRGGDPRAAIPPKKPPV